MPPPVAMMVAGCATLSNACVSQSTAFPAFLLDDRRYRALLMLLQLMVRVGELKVANFRQRMTDGRFTAAARPTRNISCVITEDPLVPRTADK